MKPGREKDYELMEEAYSSIYEQAAPPREQAPPGAAPGGVPGAPREGAPPGAAPMVPSAPKPAMQQIGNVGEPAAGAPPPGAPPAGAPPAGDGTSVLDILKQSGVDPAQLLGDQASLQQVAEGAGLEPAQLAELIQAELGTGTPPAEAPPGGPQL